MSTPSDDSSSASTPGTGARKQRLAKLNRILTVTISSAVAIILATAMIAPQARVTDPTNVDEQWGRGLTIRATPVVVTIEEPMRGTISRVLLQQMVARVRRDDPLQKYKIHAVLHALRLNGSYDRTAGLQPLGSRALLSAVLDDQQYSKLCGPVGPLLIPTDFGVTAWTSDNFAAAPHTDKIISTLGEIGISPTRPLVMRSGTGIVADLIRDSLARFDVKQNEIEWSTIAFASYLPPARTWTNRYGREFSFDDLATALLAKPMGHGPCYGTHSLYSMAYLVNVDGTNQILSRDRRQAIIERLRAASVLLQEGQYRSGHWADRWHLPAAADRGRQDPPFIARKNLLRITGHHLEWIALAPNEARPGKAHIVRACNAIANDVMSLAEPELDDHFVVLTHALRAVCLLYGIRIDDLLAQGEEHNVELAN
jgi:hypothetical protein